MSEETKTEVTLPQAVTETPAEGVEVAGEAAPEAPVYEPNYKYNIKGQELEFDEWIRPVIKSKDVEEKVRDILSRANALEGLKESRDKLSGDYGSLNEKHSGLLEEIKILRDHVSAEDFDKFFDDLGVPVDKVKAWMLKKLQYNELPQDQKELYDRKISSTREALELRRENERLSKQFEQTQTQMREADLDRVLQSAEVNQVMRSFDAKVGRIGAFRDYVVRTAIGEFHMSGEDMSAQEAVQQVLSLLGGEADHTTAGQPQVVAPQTKPVIPNIQGRGTSPVKKSPKSIEELRKQYQDQYGND